MSASACDGDAPPPGRRIKRGVVGHPSVVVARHASLPPRRSLCCLFRRVLSAPFLVLSLPGPLPPPPLRVRRVSLVPHPVPDTIPDTIPHLVAHLVAHLDPHVDPHVDPRVVSRVVPHVVPHVEPRVFSFRDLSFLDLLSIYFFLPAYLYYPRWCRRRGSPYLHRWIASPLLSPPSCSHLPVAQPTFTRTATLARVDRSTLTPTSSVQWARLFIAILFASHSPPQIRPFLAHRAPALPSVANRSSSLTRATVKASRSRSLMIAPPATTSTPSTFLWVHSKQSPPFQRV